ncbi:putative wall-associated receptor kinase-like 16 [Fagus crenata]
MGLHGMLIQITLIGVIISAIVVAAAEAALAKPGCHDMCGDVEIPFPFGLKDDCYLDETFHIAYDDNVTAKTGSLTVTNISIEVHEMRVLSYVVRDCYNPTGEYMGGEEESSAWLRAGMFTISKTKNKFTVIGCDTIALLTGEQNGEMYGTGCISVCNSLRNVVNGSCSGVGCCEVEFPVGLKNISVTVSSFNNHSYVSEFNPCGYAFVVEQGQFDFSSVYLHNFSNKMVPMVFDWAIGNVTCKEA